MVDVRVFNRRGVDKDERAMAIERAEIERLAKDRDDEKAIQERSFLNRLREKLLGRKASGGFKGIKAGTDITEEVLAEHPRGAWRHIGVQDDAVMQDIESCAANSTPPSGACRPGSTARWRSCSVATSCRPA